jgi:hypothetical protein
MPPFGNSRATTPNGPAGTQVASRPKVASAPSLPRSAMPRCLTQDLVLGVSRKVVHKLQSRWETLGRTQRSWCRRAGPPLGSWDRRARPRRPPGVEKCDRSPPVKCYIHRGEAAPLGARVGPRRFPPPGGHREPARRYQGSALSEQGGDGEDQVAPGKRRASG